MASRTNRSVGSTTAQKLAQAIAASADRSVVSVYLFGSLARGRAHRESDVDVGLLFAWGGRPSKRERFEAALLLAGRLEAAVGRRVDLVVLNDAPPLLAREVVQRGERILCADPEADHAFVRDVQLRAADLAPFLARARRVKLSRLTG
jgi:hypothetical protein